MTTRKTADWPKYSRKFEATLTANGHQHVIDKKFGVPDAIEKPMEYSKYKTDNDLFFRVLDIGLVESILRQRVEIIDSSRVVELSLLILMYISEVKSQRNLCHQCLVRVYLPQAYCPIFRGVISLY